MEALQTAAAATGMALLGIVMVAAAIRILCPRHWCGTCEMRRREMRRSMWRKMWRKRYTGPRSGS